MCMVRQYCRGLATSSPAPCCAPCCGMGGCRAVGWVVAVLCAVGWVVAMLGDGWLLWDGWLPCCGMGRCHAVGWVVAVGPQLLPAFHHLLTGLIATQHGGGIVQQMYSVGYAFTVR